MRFKIHIHAAMSRPAVVLLPSAYDFFLGGGGGGGCSGNISTIYIILINSVNFLNIPQHYAHIYLQQNTFLPT